MKLAIVGSRRFNDYSKMLGIVRNDYLHFGLEEIISGGAKGADTLAEQIAKELGVPFKVFPAEWNRFGKGAGFIRNKLIEESATDCLAFVPSASREERDGPSKGTNYTISLFRKADKEVRIVEF